MKEWRYDIVGHEGKLYKEEGHKSQERLKIGKNLQFWRGLEPFAYVDDRVFDEDEEVYVDLMQYWK